MNLPKILRKQVKRECDKLVTQMLVETDQDKVDALKRRYEGFSDILEIKWKISPDTIALIIANLAGILLVLCYEKLDIITSKAFSLIMKGRI